MNKTKLISFRVTDEEKKQVKALVKKFKFKNVSYFINFLWKQFKVGKE